MIDFTEPWYKDKVFVAVLNFFVILAIGCMILAFI